MRVLELNQQLFDLLDLPLAVIELAVLIIASKATASPHHSGLMATSLALHPDSLLPLIVLSLYGIRLHVHFTGCAYSRLFKIIIRPRAPFSQTRAMGRLNLHLVGNYDHCSH